MPAATLSSVTVMTTATRSERRTARKTRRTQQCPVMAKATIAMAGDMAATGNDMAEQRREAHRSRRQTGAFLGFAAASLVVSVLALLIH